jgi:hypothetical protein
VRSGEIAALAAALRWCAAAVGRDKAVQDEQEACLNMLMSSVAAHLLMAAVADKAEIGPAASLKDLNVARLPADELLAGVARARALGEWAGLRIALPREWIDSLIASLRMPNCPAGAAQMLVLGEAALDSYSAELGYAVSAAGLAKGGANAEFLFLRARSLPLLASSRREGCIMASLELARRERNTGLVGRILDHLNGQKENERKRWRLGSGRGDDPRIASRAVSPELLGRVLKEEQTLEQFPSYDIDQEPRYAEELGDSSCDCPDCRARRGEPVEDGEVFDDEEDDEDDFDDDLDDDEDGFDGQLPLTLKQMAERLDQLLGSLPPALAQRVAQQLKKAMAAGESPIDAIQSILGKAIPMSGSPASSQKNKKEKAARVPPPEQGSLF